MDQEAYRTVFRDHLFAFPESFWRDALTLLLILLFLAAGLALLLVYSGYMKRCALRRIFLGYANLWNSSSMREARRRAPSLVTPELLLSRTDSDICAVDAAKMLLDFFSHIALQVRQGVIAFSSVYFLYGREILNLWERRNFRIMAEKTEGSGLRPDAGFDYLASLCISERERERTDPGGSMSRSGSRFFSLSLAALSFFVLVSLAFFLFSLYLYIRS